VCCVQYMVVYQCIVAEANTAAFVLDGSSLSNLQMCCSKHSHQYAGTLLYVYCTTIVSLIEKEIPCMHCNTETMIRLSSSCCHLVATHTSCIPFPTSTPSPPPNQITPSPHDPPPRGPTGPHAPDSIQMSPTSILWCCRVASLTCKPWQWRWRHAGWPPCTT